MRFSLRTKWTLALLLTGGLPLLLCAYALFRIQALGLEVAEQEREVAMIDHIAQLVRGSLTEAADSTHRVGLLLIDARIPDPDARIALATDVINGCDALAGVAVYKSDGTLLDALYRTDGKLATGADGKLVKADLLRVFVMGKNAGWGQGVAESLRNGNWVYASYLANGQKGPDDLSTCRACHLPLAAKDFVHRYDEHFAQKK